jgi:superfamily I DNA and/or RNA helicase
MRASETILTSQDLNEKKKNGQISATFAGIKVILCTLAMLTAPPLRLINLHKRLPPQSIIVDEASQITMSDFLPAMYFLGEHIHRLGFVGDPKQRESLTHGCRDDS